MKKKWKLKHKNKWGNYNQFTDENGKQKYKNNIVINHMTGEEIEFLSLVESAGKFCELPMSISSYKAPILWQPLTQREWKMPIRESYPMYHYPEPTGHITIKIPIGLTVTEMKEYVKMRLDNVL